MAEIIRQAGRDNTGEALQGLKTAFGDYLLQQASTRTATTTGDFIVSGASLKRLLGQDKISRMAQELFSPDELKRLDEIVSIAGKLEKAVAAKARPEGVIADRPAVIMQALAGIVGAQLGRQTAKATGGGTVQTPGIFANLFRNALAKRVQDPARRLIFDAIQDKDLFAALLRGNTKADQKFVKQQLNAWLVSIGAEQLEDSEFGPDTPRP
jgi:hypothetical protein